MAKRQNPWLVHLKSFWAKNKGKMSYRQAMVSAKKSYSKVKKKKLFSEKVQKKVQFFKLFFELLERYD